MFFVSLVASLLVGLSIVAACHAIARTHANPWTVCAIVTALGVVLLAALTLPIAVDNWTNAGHGVLAMGAIAGVLVDIVRRAYFVAYGADTGDDADTWDDALGAPCLCETCFLDKHGELEDATPATPAFLHGQPWTIDQGAHAVMLSDALQWDVPQWGASIGDRVVFAQTLDCVSSISALLDDDDSTDVWSMGFVTHPDA